MAGFREDGSGKSATTNAILRSGGYTTSFTAPTGGTLLVNWYTPQGAHLPSTGLHRGPYTGSVTPTIAGQARPHRTTASEECNRRPATTGAIATATPRSFGAPRWLPPETLLMQSWSGTAEPMVAGRLIRAIGMSPEGGRACRAGSRQLLYHGGNRPWPTGQDECYISIVHLVIRQPVQIDGAGALNAA